MEIAIDAFELFGFIEDRVLGDFATAAKQMSACIASLTKWEDEHLLDNPTPEALAAHKKTLSRLIKLLKFFALATEAPDFPDRGTAELIQASLATIKDKITLWHGLTMNKAEADQILATCFPNES